MQLTLAEFPVRHIRLGSVYRYQDGLLEVDQEDLVDRYCRIRAFYRRVSMSSVPASRCGLPASATWSSRGVKIDGAAQVFPGVIGPVLTVGDGVTHRLSGMAVLATAAYEGTIRAGTGVQRSAMLDMWGAGAAASRFSALRHLVLILEIRAGLGELAAHQAIQHAAFLSRLQARRNDRGFGPGAYAGFRDSE